MINKAYQYDVFISFKNLDDNKNQTKDSVIAEKLYNYLTGSGLRVFFSMRELEIMGVSDYSSAIDEALDSSRFMVVVGCSAKNLMSNWVHAEWRSFVNEINSGFKPDGEVFVVYRDMTIRELPLTLRQRQAFDDADESSLEKVRNFILNAINRDQQTSPTEISYNDDTVEVFERDTDDKYTNERTIENNLWIPFGETVKGASHIRKDFANQDALKIYRGEVPIGIKAISESNTRVTPSVVAVSDGHGSSKHIRSADGSALAVETMCNLAESMLREIPNSLIRVRVSEINANAEQIKAQFLNKWQQAVDSRTKSHPLTEKEQSILKLICSDKDRAEIENDFALVADESNSMNEKPSRVAYGCTFLAAVAYEDVVLLMKYGDGDVLGLYPNGEVKELIVVDQRNMGDEPLSLCSLINPAEIQHSVLVGSGIPMLITLSTDGVKNSFDDLAAEKGSGFRKIPIDIKNLLLKHEFRTNIVSTILNSELARITRYGSGDDVTLGVLYDEKRIRIESD